MPGSSRSTSSAQQKRAFWLKHLHQWHWMSAALCLVGMALFSITGFTLNHAISIQATPQITTTTTALPEEILSSLNRSAPRQDGELRAPLPPEVAQWLAREHSIRVAGAVAEWSQDEVYLSLPRPGGDAWLAIDRETGDMEHELTRRGVVSYLNDLHKGRNTGAAWSLFIDVFAFAALIFAATGLCLLKMHSKHRPGTWPMVTLGLVLPLLIGILFIH